MPSTHAGQAMAQAFGRSNPELARGLPPGEEPGAGARVCADRVVQAGGALASLLMHPTFVPFEMLYRTLPEQGMFGATPERNFIFELGSFQVPAQMAFCFVDYAFRPYRLSGAMVGDTVPLESRRMSTLFGFDVLIDKTRKGNLTYNLEPQPIIANPSATQRPQSGGSISQGITGTTGVNFDGALLALVGGTSPSAPQGPNASQFNAGPYARVAAPGASGLSLMPNRTTRQGPLPLPFTYIVRENQRVQFTCTIFRNIPIPLAFFEVDVTGILMPQNTALELLEGMKPCQPQGYGGFGP